MEYGTHSLISDSRVDALPIRGKIQLGFVGVRNLIVELRNWNGIFLGNNLNLNCSTLKCMV